MMAGYVSRLSATLLAFCGLALLFAGDEILPRHLPGYPPGEVWFGQLLAAACLAMAALNWLSRHTLLGGIYGRPVVAANATGYFIAAITLLRPTLAGAFRPAGLLLTIPVTALAVAYAWLMFRGPFERDVAAAKQGAA
ncbi:MAG: hypothetical protein KA267_07500 [Gemmatimonadales bacterium]|nr:hypothetical protein [Gemmatimonadales bacterium]MBP6571535.1 hypothetical protein [Gemmatimonadales bacterium]MBP7620110.1 hypothetical protein [Gemmatimonadales bacterium]